jgi:hypothetical protein
MPLRKIHHPVGAYTAPTMEPVPARPRHEAVDHDDLLVHEWRLRQLTRLGIPWPLAQAAADHVGWHQGRQAGAPRLPAAAGAPDRPVREFPWPAAFPSSYPAGLRRLLRFDEEGAITNIRTPTHPVLPRMLLALPAAPTRQSSPHTQSGQPGTDTPGTKDRKS